MEYFTLSKRAHVFCRSENTRYGFRHLATLYVDNHAVNHAKACYYNRTWEAYDFQSVVHRVIENHFSPQLAARFKKKADRSALGEIDKHFGMVSAVASLGSILCDKREDANRFKKRMLGTIPGIDFPEDFDSLSEAEKQKRLDGAISTLSPSQEVPA